MTACKIYRKVSTLQMGRDGDLNQTSDNAKRQPSADRKGKRVWGKPEITPSKSGLLYWLMKDRTGGGTLRKVTRRID